MRALEITYILIILQATIGLVNGIGIFNEDYYVNVNNTFTEYEITDLSTHQNQIQQPNILTEAAGLVELAWGAIFNIGKILLAVVLIYPVIVDTFHLEDYTQVTALLAVVQVGIWVLYTVAFFEFITNRSTGATT